MILGARLDMLIDLQVLRTRVQEPTDSLSDDHEALRDNLIKRQIIYIH